MDGAEVCASTARLVGCDELLDRLPPAIHPGSGTVLVEIVGEPGIGKSTLLRTLYRRGSRNGLAVVGNTCPSMLRAVPYSAMLPLLRHLRTGLDADGRPVADADPDELHHAVRALLNTADKPVLVGIDDAHAADPQSLGLLGRLLHDPPQCGLTLAVAYRPIQAPATLAAALQLCDNAVRHERLDVEPLSAATLGNVLDVPAGKILDRLHRASGGNPLYAQVLAGELADDPAGGQLAYRALAHSATQTVRSEFAGLREDELSVLQYAAVAGDCFDPDVVFAVCPLPEPARAAALERLLHRDLLRTSADDTLGFRHPVLRALIYRQLPATSRRGMHAQLATELATRYTVHPDLATHVSRSARPGDLSAVRLLVTSARRAGPHQPDTALTYLTAAQQLLGTGGDADLQAELRCGLALAHLHSGQVATARTILHAGVPVGTGSQQRVRHVLSRARADRALGHHREAMAALHAAIDHIGDDKPGTVLLALEAAVCGAFGGEMSEATRYAALAQQAASTVTDSAFHAVVSSTQALLASLSSDTADTDRHIAAAAEILDGLPDSHLAHMLDPFGMLGWAELQRERDHEALRHFHRAIDVAADAGHVDLLPYLHTGCCYANSRLGRLPQATEAGQRAVDAARRLGTRAPLVLALSFRASVVAHVSGPDAARDDAEASLSVMSPARRDLFGEIAQRLAVRIRASVGDPGGSSQALLRACGGTDLSWVEVATRPYWCTVLADMCLATGEVANADNWADRAAVAATGLGLSGASAHVATARSRLLVHHGQSEAALAQAQRAVAGFQALGWVLDEIGARLLVASLQATLEQWPPMSVELAEARRLVERAGSPWLRRVVIAEQRRLQARVGGSTAGTGVLSLREREIAELAADGATNGDIAARLHVTVKTVEAHLSRIYRKLGVRSRAMLATALAQQR